MFPMKDSPELAQLVTFVPNKKLPIYNWYYYKEGYSKDLVDLILKSFDVKKDDIVLDPFIGVGTTLLACKQAGIPSVGFDVSPMALIASLVKTRNYDMKALEDAIKLVGTWKFELPRNVPTGPLYRKYFHPRVLEDIIFYKNKVMQIEDEYVRDFLLLALIDTMDKTSYAVKEGGSLRVDKRRGPPVKHLFKRKIKSMYKNLEAQSHSDVVPTVFRGDARQMDLEDESVDFVITSPPYLNKIEYTQIYKLELNLFFEEQTGKVRAHVGERDVDLYYEGDMPPIANAYFDDMTKVMQELYRVCKPGAKLAIVIGGGCLPDQVIECDTKLAEIAEKIGFAVNGIDIARNIWCTRNRTEKIGITRESLIELEKK